MSLPSQSLLEWRYATKKFDPNKKIHPNDLNSLLEVLRLAPSSYGLEPWKFVVVDDPKLRVQLKVHSWNQPQITDASNLIVLCVLKKIDVSYVKSFVKRMAEIRGVTQESLAQYEGMMTSFVSVKSPEWLSEWMKRQVYIALGMLLSECARRKIDTCPMEGFDPQKFDEILGLEKYGLQSVVLCTVGYRAPDDHAAELKKVRYSTDEVILRK